MHFEFLVEDASGKLFLDKIVPKIIGSEHTFEVKSYKGIGRIPAKMTKATDTHKRILLDNPPRLLQGYGKSWQGYEAVVIVVCDLDDKCLKQFRQELLAVFNQCNPQPETRFCIAVEEGEAWLLGDIAAIKKAFPHAKNAVLDTYENDAICGTWEKLADAIYKGGAKQLKLENSGAAKCDWAKKITPFMTIENNQSPSFNYFVKKLQEFA